MARSSFIDPTSDLGRHLSMDVATLALTLPAVARQAFAAVILPFVYAASLLLVVLFLTPFRDIPFVAQQATHGLSMLRNFLIVAAVLNLILDGYLSIEPLSTRWIATAAVAVLSLGIITIDLRRMFSS